MQQPQQQEQIAPELPPRPPPRPRPVCVNDCCIVQIDTSPSLAAVQSPPTPSHYEPPPVPSINAPSHQHEGTPGRGGAAAPAAAAAHGRISHVARGTRFWSNALRKYVILCTACGGMAALLGALFLLVHFVLRAHTSSLNYFETVPTYIPAVMLTVTGLVVMCFARRKNRYGYLIKLCGVCCLVCAALCVVVTVTTTVIHMNRLQTLKECVYSPAHQACTCYTIRPRYNDPPSLHDEPGATFVFNNTTDCDVVHGALYSCLRALFGLSVIGILVCIFSCMLVYQLLSHEKKKMYWEQLEMRCRYLYGSRRNPQYAYCGCNCDDCPRPFPPHAAATAHTPHNEMFAWPNTWEQQGYLDDRFCTRVQGNLYTPSPDEPSQQQSAANRERRWSWLPWNRAAAARDLPAQPVIPEQRTPGDSEYGFGAALSRGRSMQGCQVTPVCRPIASHAFVTEASGSGGIPRYLWGPPPPYSQPPSSGSSSNATSPVRQQPDINIRHHHPTSPHHQHSVSSPQHQVSTPEALTPAHSLQTVSCSARIRASEDKINDISSCTGTLPCRKSKKRLSDSPVSASIIKSQQIQPSSIDTAEISSGRKIGPGIASIRGIFTQAGSKHESCITQSAPTSTNNSPHKVAAPSGVRRLTAAQLRSTTAPEATESEVYFADVSSCNGGPESSLYDEPNSDAVTQEYVTIPRLYTERLAPDAQYEISGNEDDAPMRDSDATIDSGVHSGSEINSRLRQTQRVQATIEPLTRSVNV